MPPLSADERKDRLIKVPGTREGGDAMRCGRSGVVGHRRHYRIVYPLLLRKNGGRGASGGGRKCFMSVKKVSPRIEKE